MQRDLEAGGKALLSLLPSLAQAHNDAALEAAERLVLMLIGVHDLASFGRQSTASRQSLLATPPPGMHGWQNLQHLHEEGGLLHLHSASLQNDDEREENDANGVQSNVAHMQAADEAWHALGGVAMAEALEACQALLPVDAHHQHLMAQARTLEWTLPRRIGPRRGVARQMPQNHALHLSKALHMLRALRLSHPNQTLVSGWGELGSEGGAELLKDDCCSLVLGVIAVGLESASLPSPRDPPPHSLLGWGPAEDGMWLAHLVPSMLLFSRCVICCIVGMTALIAARAIEQGLGKLLMVAVCRWRTYALASRVAALTCSVWSKTSCQDYIHGLHPVFLSLL